MPYTIHSLDALPETLLQEISNQLDPDYFSLSTPDQDAIWSDQLDQLQIAQVLIHSMTDVTQEILDAAPNLQLVLKYQMRPGKVDTDLLKRRGIAYRQIPCMALFSVAEFTVMMILIQAKEFIRAYEETRAETWLPDLQPVLTTQTSYPYNWVGLKRFNTLAGRMVGIIGMGTVGKAVAQLLQPFGMQVLYYDIYRLSSEQERELNITFAPLDELLQTADFVTVHLRLTEETENFMSEREFALMKPSAFFINTSRGRVVKEEALASALRDRTIAGAALDVFWYEPLPSDSPLRTLDNLILTPHVAGIPLDANADMEAEMFVSTINTHFELA